jgi:predicted NBD/HSP70 family sugar kinase
MQTAVLDRSGRLTFSAGVAVPGDIPVLVASPGLVRGTRVVAASNLGWFDLPVGEALGLEQTVHLLRNDAEAAALGEHVLRDLQSDLVYVGLGTGVGGAVVRDGEVLGNLLGHASGFGDKRCPCGLTGCLETVAAGWALSDPATDAELALAAEAVAQAVRSEPLATPELVVVAGGLARRHPQLVELVASALPHRVVQPTAAPPAAKSAAAWGLLHLRTA